MIQKLVEIYCLVENLTSKIDDHIKKIRLAEKVN